MKSFLNLALVLSTFAATGVMAANPEGTSETLTPRPGVSRVYIVGESALAIYNNMSEVPVNAMVEKDGRNIQCWNTGREAPFCILEFNQKGKAMRFDNWK